MGPVDDRVRVWVEIFGVQLGMGAGSVSLAENEPKEPWDFVERKGVTEGGAGTPSSGGDGDSDGIVKGVSSSNKKDEHSYSGAVCSSYERTGGALCCSGELHVGRKGLLRGGGKGDLELL